MPCTIIIQKGIIIILHCTMPQDTQSQSRGLIYVLNKVGKPAQFVTHTTIWTPQSYIKLTRSLINLILAAYIIIYCKWWVFIGHGVWCKLSFTCYYRFYVHAFAVFFILWELTQIIHIIWRSWIFLDLEHWTFLDLDLEHLFTPNITYAHILPLFPTSVWTTE